MKCARLLMLLAAMVLAACEQVIVSGPVGDATITITELRSGNVMAMGETDNEADVIERKGQQVYDDFNDIRKLRQLGQTSYSEEVTFEDDTWYVITATGGFDFDPNGDQVMDAPTQVLGSVHAIVKGSTLNTRGFAVTPLTESLYQWIAEHADLLTDQEIQDFLDVGAAELVNDVDTSGVADYVDLLIANPVQNTYNLVVSKSSIDALAGSIAAGSPEGDIQQQARELFSSNAPPGVAEAVYEASVATFIQNRCGLCHNPGLVGANSSRNMILPPSDPDYVAANTQNFVNLVTAESVQYVLGKASRTIAHGGGVRLPVGDPDYDTFEEWLKLL